MKDREDDSGLAGKVAIISGGGEAGGLVQKCLQDAISTAFRMLVWAPDWTVK